MFWSHIACAPRRAAFGHAGAKSKVKVWILTTVSHVITQVNGKLIPTASVSENLVVEWLNDGVPDATVREA